jgi:Leucine Rich repeat
VSVARGRSPCISTNTASESDFTLKDLTLSWSQIDDQGIHLLANALVGNTTIEKLNIAHNKITSRGLDDITRMIESTQLKTITTWGNQDIFNDIDATRHFASTLQYKNATLQELEGREYNRDPKNSSINNSLKRNQQLNRVTLLLVPPPPPRPQQRQYYYHATTTMMLKTWHKAIAKFATVPNNNNAGASAIFKLFTSRPQLLEKRIQRPAAAAATTTGSLTSR